MRAVADTNVVVSGLLWHGPSHEILNAARRGVIELFVSVPLLVELQDVLNREKFRPRFELAGVKPHDLVVGYAALATLVQPASIAPVIRDDPDDDAVLACALAAQAVVIVSGDQHLLGLKRLGEIEILKPAECITRLSI